MTHTTAPEYIDRDTYTGRWRVAKSPRNAPAAGIVKRVSTFLGEPKVVES